ncbi:MAG: hypothetical protein M3367_09625 [Acidobacteriota bacterium]|nr:hypothetical protein [Acidobacteriota bacterium]
MSEPVTVRAKYIFLDVVKFSLDRSVEAQVDIIEELNRIVKSAISEFKIPNKSKILLPTGDGMCIALLDFEKGYDDHLRLALSILRQVHKFKTSTKDIMRQFDVRIGLNANTDIRVTDVSGKRNIAGAGINMAQRIMSMADGSQILVGESVYSALQPFEKYLLSFTRYEAIDKHGKPFPVYQYKVEGETGLNTESPTAFQNPDLKGAARACGLQNVYPFRNEDAKDDLIEDVKNAKERIWLLGVGLSEEVRLEELLPILERKVKEVKNIEVKLLLLDALQSPAVFRTFLESDLTVFKNSFRDSQFKNSFKDSPGSRFRHPYFGQRLYRDFENAYEVLKKASNFKAASRFYAHNPNCWLAIIDNTAYFQPYTFGGNIAQENLSIGSLLPVFKLQSKAEVDIFSILEDHFNKLWVTSNADLFHVGARIEDRDRVIKLILRGGKGWLKHVYGALNENKKSPGKDRRRYPRKHCESPIRDVTVSWGMGKASRKINPEIVDFSRESARLKLKESTYPAKGKTVKLEIPPDTGRDDREMLAAKYLKEKLVEPTKGTFKVMRVADDHSYIALQAHIGKSAV